MTIEHVKIYKIREYETTVIVLQGGERLLNRLRIVLCSKVLRHSQRIIDGGYFANADYIEIFSREGRKQIPGRWRYCIIVPVLGAIETARLAQKRSRNNATNLVFPIKKLPSCFANFIEPAERNYFFIGSDLKNR